MQGEWGEMEGRGERGVKKDKREGEDGLNSNFLWHPLLLLFQIPKYCGVHSTDSIWILFQLII